MAFPTSGCVAYYRLDDTSGTDATGSGYTGTLVGSPSLVTGKINSCLSFGGASDYVKNTSFPLTAAISVSCWVNATSFSHSYNAIVTAVSAGSSYISPLVKSTGKLAFYLFASTQVAYDGTGSNTLSTGTWYHLVCTYDSTSGLKGYVNGSLDGSVAASGSISAVTSEMRIASQSNAAGREWDGLIDEVGIWNRALTSTEVSDLYNSGSGLSYPGGGGSTQSLFRPSLLNGIGSGGPFFNNPIGRSMLGWRPKLVTA